MAKNIWELSVKITTKEIINENISLGFSKDARINYPLAEM